MRRFVDKYGFNTFGRLWNPFATAFVIYFDIYQYNTISTFQLQNKCDCHLILNEIIIIYFHIYDRRSDIISNNYKSVPLL